MIRRGTVLVALALAAGLSAPARAQLVREQVDGNRRICIYYGSDSLPGDQTLDRALAVGLGQSCPLSAPYVDPNAPAPPNAAFLGEETNATQRVCRYGEGGIEYRLSIALTRRCAMTPALLDRQP